MDAFSSFFDSGIRSWSYDSLKNLRQISPSVQNHLKRVYLTLCCLLVASAFGAYLSILWNTIDILITIGCVLIMIWLLSISCPSYKQQTSLSLVFVSAVLEGTFIGPLIKKAVDFDFDPSILVTAFVGVALGFVCFSGAAMLARRREHLYLGGLLSSGLSMLMWLQLASVIFGRSSSILMFNLYFGLLIYVGYIVVHTQTIIEKAHLGDMDYMKHSLTLLIDFVNVFRKILIIMLENSANKEEKKKKKKRRN